MNFLPLLFALTFCQADDLPPVWDVLPLVEEEVEIISIAHWGGDCQMAFYWGIVQGEMVLLDHRWLYGKESVQWHDGYWCMTWHDESEYCYRIVRTKCFVESWEPGNPLTEGGDRPWFANLLEPGLRKPPKVEVEAK